VPHASSYEDPPTELCSYHSLVLLNEDSEFIRFLFPSVLLSLLYYLQFDRVALHALLQSLNLIAREAIMPNK